VVHRLAGLCWLNKRYQVGFSCSLKRESIRAARKIWAENEVRIVKLWIRNFGLDKLKFGSIDLNLNQSIF
jgi:hypothetical protein